MTYSISNCHCQDGTLKFIWSLGASDVISYHGANRGSKSVQALYDQPQVDLDKSVFYIYLLPRFKNTPT